MIPPVPASVLAVALALAVGGGGIRGDSIASGATDRETAFMREEPFVVRPFVPMSGDRWIGNAVAYGPHRDGQFPGGPAPSRAELRQDLGLMLRHWNLVRVYNSVGPAETLLELIRRDRLDMKVMLGVWVAPEETRDSTGRVTGPVPGAHDANRREIEGGLRLAATYPEIVVALCIGNETQVSWSDHRVPPELLVATLREMRARSRVPVTTADDFNFWNKPESREVAREVDFITTHYHPLWNGRQLDEALDWTARTVAEIQAFHPDRTVVLGETGWATQRHTEGDQGRLMKGRLGEAEQAEYWKAVTAWAARERVTTFVFEAFDENWKGGAHPDEVEKHWGLYRADRTPKRAVAGEP